MAGYGQFCSVARAHVVRGGRWTLLVVPDLLCGNRRFNDIRRGIPRISHTVLSERLRGLVFIGIVEARRMGVAFDGPAALARAFPGWFERYRFAHIAPASGARRRHG